MAEYFVVFNQANTGEDESTSREAPGSTTVKTLEGAKTAKFVKLEASSIAEAQSNINGLYPGGVTTTPIVVAALQWKES